MKMVKKPGVDTLPNLNNLWGSLGNSQTTFKAKGEKEIMKCQRCIVYVWHISLFQLLCVHGTGISFQHAFLK